MMLIIIFLFATLSHSLRTSTYLHRWKFSKSRNQEVDIVTQFGKNVHSSNSTPRKSVALSAKKKLSKLLSDDFLSSVFDDMDEAADDSTSSGTTKIKNKKKEKSKDKKKDGISTDSAPLADSLTDLDDKTPMLDVKKGKNKSSKGTDEKKKNDHKVESSDIKNKDSKSVKPVAEPVELTIEQKLRKEKPPARVRFQESSQPDYVMMGLDHVSLVFGNTVVLKDSSFSVATGERVGLVGPNGGGKTTQLKILAGELEPTTGEITKSSRNLRIAFLRQEFIDELNPEAALREELFKAFTEEQKILSDLSDCEEELANTADDPEKMEEVLDRLQQLQDKAISKGVYALDGKVDRVMDTMGFSSADAKLLVKSFSGGWKMRIGLAKILLKDPNVLLLDEPTNHLDIDSVIWLEGFLAKQNIPMVIVSHDREFLDKVCNKIVDVEDGVTVTYQGNYSKFIEQKRARIETWREKYEKQMRFVKEEEKWIKKAKNDPSMSQQVKAKEQSMERMKASEDWVEPPPRDKKFRFRFPPAPRCGMSVIEMVGMSHGYGPAPEDLLFENVNIQVDKGDRVGLVGPNGAGKSTLMRMIHGDEEPMKGYVEFGSANVVANYFEQNQADSFDLDKTVFEVVRDSAPPEYTQTDIRGLLGQFMFKGDDADKQLRMLSGGEKGRVALCKMMVTPANLLLLDEPTNHLDIASKEVLEDAIRNFDGSVVVIAHDRYFMSQIANSIFSFENKKVVQHNCDYHDYMMEKDGLQEKVEGRYVSGDKYRITNMQEVVRKTKEKKNFGGSGVTCGNLNKGIKNAKRFNS